MNKIVISWAGNDEIESFSPHCTAINRTFSYLNIDFELKPVYVNSKIQGVPNKLTGLPAVIDGNKKYLGFRNCINYLKQLRGESDLFTLNFDEAIQEQILKDWCINTLWASVVYFSYKDNTGLNAMKKKYHKQAKYVQDINETPEETVNPVREAILKKASEYEIFLMDQDHALDHFERQVKYINELLGNKNYIFGNEMKFIDIMFFSYLNRILISGLAPADMIKQKYHRIIKWLQKVAALTRSKDNIYPTHLEK